MNALLKMWFWFFILAFLALFIAIVFFEFGYQEEDQEDLVIASYAVLGLSFLLFFLGIIFYLADIWCYKEYIKEKTVTKKVKHKIKSPPKTKVVKDKYKINTV